MQNEVVVSQSLRGDNYKQDIMSIYYNILFIIALYSLIAMSAVV